MKYIFFLFLLVGCSSISADDAFTIDVLYEHTILMLDTTSDETLVAIGLDASALNHDAQLTAEQKINALEAAYGMQTTGSTSQRIDQLEKRMIEMMDEWVELQDFS